MQSRVPRGFEFLEPWFSCDGGLEIQLAREVPKGHRLYGVAARSVARHLHDDDVLFELSGDHAPALLAVVHLTWSSGPEISADYPATQLYDSFTDWVETCMQPEADSLDSMREQNDARESATGVSSALEPSPRATTQHEGWALEFICPHTLEALSVRLNETGEWSWQLRDSAYYGDYLSAASDGMRIRVHEGQQQSANGAIRYSALVETIPGKGPTRERLDAAFRTVLDRLGATDVRAIAWYD